MKGRRWIERAWSAPPAKPPAGSWILSGLAAFYGMAIGLRRPHPLSAGVPTVSVGSLLVGGAGKTPLAIELAEMAERMGLRPAILLRGYGGRNSRAGVKVSAEGASCADLYGDEACLHARRGHAGVWVGRDRLVAAESASAAGARLLILDDGMQHRRIHRDLEIVTLPAWHPFGNGRLLPRGPLREPTSALRRADLIVLSHVATGPELEEATRTIRQVVSAPPIVSWTGSVELRSLQGAIPPDGAAVGAFCGIGRPLEFRRSLQRAGYEVHLFRSYPDHHAFTPGEMGALVREAQRESLSYLVTTEKDALRLPAGPPRDGVSFCEAVLSVNWSSGDDRETVLAAMRAIAPDAE